MDYPCAKFGDLAVLVLSYRQTESQTLMIAITQARFPFKRNRLRCVRCVNDNRKKRKRLRLNGNRD